MGAREMRHTVDAQIETWSPETGRLRINVEIDDRSYRVLDPQSAELILFVNRKVLGEWHAFTMFMETMRRIARAPDFGLFPKPVIEAELGRGA